MFTFEDVYLERFYCTKKKLIDCIVQFLFDFKIKIHVINSNIFFALALEHFLFSSAALEHLLKQAVNLFQKRTVQEITNTRFSIINLYGIKNFPEHVLCDYEQAIINFIKKCFPSLCKYLETGHKWFTKSFQ